MNSSSTKIGPRAKTIGVVSSIILVLTVAISLIIFVLSRRELNADNQYDFWLLALGLFAALVVCTAGNCVLFVVTALVARQETATRGRFILLLLSFLHLIVFGYFVISYTTDNMFLF